MICSIEEDNNSGVRDVLCALHCDKEKNDNTNERTHNKRKKRTENEREKESWSEELQQI